MKHWLFIIEFITIRNEVAKVMFFTRVHLSTGWEYLGRYPRTRYTPGTRYTPLWPGTPPRPGTLPPLDQVHPWDQVHPRPVAPPGTRYTPMTRYTPWDQVYHPLGPGTPPKRWLLLQMVCILLECILVLKLILWTKLYILSNCSHL